MLKTEEFSCRMPEALEELYLPDLGRVIGISPR
jgi:hypothetical protein